MLVTEILGALDQLDVGSRKVDLIRLQWYEASRRLLRKTSDAGVDVAFKLFHEGASLKHDDVVALDEQTAWVIAIEPCQVIVCAPQTMAEMARACYEIGNKHAPLFLVGNELLMPYDKPMFEWLAAAGFAPKKDERRLSNPMRSNSVQGHAGNGHVGHGHPYEHGHGDFKNRLFRAK